MSNGRIPILLTLNGKPVSLEVRPHHTLLEVLRGQLGLTGTKTCCTEGECGACTVLLEGETVNSCLVLAVEVDGCDVMTIEGLAGEEQLDPLQEAFIAEGAVQCGYCIPGMVMTAKGLLLQNPHPSETEVKEALAGNLCRCGGYHRIVRAVHTAAGKPVPPMAGEGSDSLRDGVR